MIKYMCNSYIAIATVVTTEEEEEEGEEEEEQEVMTKSVEQELDINRFTLT